MALDRQSPITIFDPAGVCALAGAVRQHRYGNLLRRRGLEKLDNAVDPAGTDIDHPEPVQHQRVDMGQDIDEPRHLARHGPSPSRRTVRRDAAPHTSR